MWQNQPKPKGTCFSIWSVMNACCNECLDSTAPSAELLYVSCHTNSILGSLCRTYLERFMSTNRGKGQSGMPHSVHKATAGVCMRAGMIKASCAATRTRVELFVPLRATFSVVWTQPAPFSPWTAPCCTLCFPWMVQPPLSSHQMEALRALWSVQPPAPLHLRLLAISSPLGPGASLWMSLLALQLLRACTWCRRAWLCWEAMQRSSASLGKTGSSTTVLACSPPVYKCHMQSCIMYTLPSLHCAVFDVDVSVNGYDSVLTNPAFSGCKHNFNSTFAPALAPICQAAVICRGAACTKRLCTAQ
jgi:hypothetical protein